MMSDLQYETCHDKQHGRGDLELSDRIREDEEEETKYTDQSSFLSVPFVSCQHTTSVGPDEETDDAMDRSKSVAYKTSEDILSRDTIQRKNILADCERTVNVCSEERGKMEKDIIMDAAYEGLRTKEDLEANTNTDQVLDCVSSSSFSPPVRTGPIPHQLSTQLNCNHQSDVSEDADASGYGLLLKSDSAIDVSTKTLIVKPGVQSASEQILQNGCSVNALRPCDETIVCGLDIKLEKGESTAENDLLDDRRVYVVNRGSSLSQKEACDKNSIAKNEPFTAESSSESCEKTCLAENVVGQSFERGMRSPSSRGSFADGDIDNQGISSEAGRQKSTLPHTASLNNSIQWLPRKSQERFSLPDSHNMKYSPSNPETYKDVVSSFVDGFQNVITSSQQSRPIGQLQGAPPIGVGNKTLKCPSCNWHYKYQETLEIHQREKHPDIFSSSTTNAGCSMSSGGAVGRGEGVASEADLTAAANARCRFCMDGEAHPRLARGESYTCGYKPYRCDVCGYSTTTKGNLSIHMQSDRHVFNAQELQGERHGDLVSLPLQLIPASHGAATIAFGSTSGNVPSTYSSRSLEIQTASPPLSAEIRPSVSRTKLQTSSWRCDICCYETNVARNLRIHMSSEKHANNAMAAQSAGHQIMLEQAERAQQYMTHLIGNAPLCNTQLHGDYQNLTQPLASRGIASHFTSQFLGDMTSNKSSSLSSQSISTSGRHRESNSDVAQNLSRVRSSLEYAMAASAPASSSNRRKLQDAVASSSDITLYRCAVCNVFSTDSIEELYEHEQRDRTRSGAAEVDAIIVEGGSYICTLCQYRSNLRANFQLHCKTDKHQQRVQLVNHVREGGSENEWRHFLQGNNYGNGSGLSGGSVPTVWCRACNQGATDVQRLRAHTAEPEHVANVRAILMSTVNIASLMALHDMRAEHKDVDMLTLKSDFNIGETVGESLVRRSEAGYTAVNDYSCVKSEPDLNYDEDRLLRETETESKQELEKGKRTNRAETMSIDAIPSCSRNFSSDDEETHRPDQKGKLAVGNSSQVSTLAESNLALTCRLCHQAFSVQKELMSHLFLDHNVRQELLHVLSTSDEIARSCLSSSISRPEGEDKSQSVYQTTIDNKSADARIRRCVFSDTDDGSNGPDRISDQNGVAFTSSSQFDRFDDNSRKESIDRCCNQTADDCKSVRKKIPSISSLEHFSVYKNQDPSLVGRSQLIRQRSKPDVSPNDQSVFQLANQTDSNQHEPTNKTSVNETEFDVHKHGKIRSSGELDADCNADQHRPNGDPDDGYHSMSVLDTSLPSEDGSINVTKMSAVSNTLLRSLNSHAAQVGSGFRELKDNYSTENKLVTKREKYSNEDKDAMSSSSSSASSPPSLSWSRRRSSFRTVLRDIGLECVKRYNESVRNRRRRRRKKRRKEVGETDAEPAETTAVVSSTMQKPWAARQHLTNDSIGETNNTTGDGAGRAPSRATAQSRGACSLCFEEFTSLWALKEHCEYAHGLDRRLSATALEESDASVRKRRHNGEQLAQQQQKIQQKWQIKQQLHDEKQWLELRKRFCETGSCEEDKRAERYPSPKVDPSFCTEENGLTSQEKGSTSVKPSSSVVDDPSFKAEQCPRMKSSFPMFSPVGISSLNTTIKTSPPKLNSHHLFRLPPGPHSSISPATFATAPAMDQYMAASILTMGMLDPTWIMMMMMGGDAAALQQLRSSNAMQQLCLGKQALELQDQQLLKESLIAGQKLQAAPSRYMPSSPDRRRLRPEEQLVQLIEQQSRGSYGYPNTLLLHETSFWPKSDVDSVSQQADMSMNAEEKVNIPTQRQHNKFQYHEAEQEQQQRQHDRQRNQQHQQKRARTRINDDQLTVLRANFDLGNSPSDDQIAAMSERTLLPAKVIKHWFRNTLFKERQRSKDSPYNFNIPPSSIAGDSEHGGIVHEEDHVGDNSEWRVSDIRAGDNICDLVNTIAVTSEENQMVEARNVKHSNNNDSLSTDVKEKQKDQISNEREKTIVETSAEHASDDNKKEIYVAESKPSKCVLDQMVVEGLPLSCVPPACSMINAPLAVSSPVSTLMTTESAPFEMVSMKQLQATRELKSEIPPTNKLMTSTSALVSGAITAADISRQFGSRVSSSSCSVSGEGPLAALTGGMMVGMGVGDKQHSQFNAASPSSSSSHHGGGGGSRRHRGEGGRRATRTHFTDHQVKLLQEHFETNAYPKDEELETLSAALDLSSRVIIVWFQNARQKARKSYENQPPTASTSDITDPQTSTPSETELKQLQPTLSEGCSEWHDRTEAAAAGQSHLPNSERSINYECKRCSVSFESYYELIKHHRSRCGTVGGDGQKQDGGRDIVVGTQGVGYLYGQNSADLLSNDKNCSKPISKVPATHETQGEFSGYGIAESSVKYSNPEYHVPQTTNSSRSDFSPSVISSAHTVKTIPTTSILQLQCGSAFDFLRSAAKLLDSKTPLTRPGDQLEKSEPYQLSTSGETVDGDQSRMSSHDRRMRTTITPDQLEYLNVKFRHDSNPSRKQLNTIAADVGLSKRVVQVWFQNTRARERKILQPNAASDSGETSFDQYHSSCPFCSATFNSASALDTHVTSRHLNELTQKSDDVSVQTTRGDVQEQTTLLGEDANRGIATVVSRGQTNNGVDLPQLMGYPYHLQMPFVNFGQQTPTTQLGFLCSTPPPSLSTSALPKSEEGLKEGLKERRHEHFKQDKSKSFQDGGRADQFRQYLSSLAVLQTLGGGAYANLTGRETAIDARATQGENALFFGADGAAPGFRPRLYGDQVENSGDEAPLDLSKPAKTDCSSTRSFGTVSASINLPGGCKAGRQPLGLPCLATTPQSHHKSENDDDVNSSQDYRSEFRQSSRDDSASRWNTDAPSTRDNRDVEDEGAGDDADENEGGVDDGFSGESMPAPGAQASAATKRHRTHMSSTQIRAMKAIYTDYRTPTISECDALGREIGLRKRVVQVWFQNARAKDKKIRLTAEEAGIGGIAGAGYDAGATPPSECRYCRVRYSTSLPLREHLFSREHIEAVQRSIRGLTDGDMTKAGGRRSGGGARGRGGSRGNEHKGPGHSLVSKQMMDQIMANAELSTLPRASSSIPTSILFPQAFNIIPASYSSPNFRARLSGIAGPINYQQELSALAFNPALNMSLFPETNMLLSAVPTATTTTVSMPGAAAVSVSTPGRREFGAPSGPNSEVDRAAAGVPLSMLMLPTSCIRSVEAQLQAAWCPYHVQYTQDDVTLEELKGKLSNSDKAVVRETHIDVGYICRRCHLVFPRHDLCTRHQSDSCYRGKDTSQHGEDQDNNEKQTIIKLEQTLFECMLCTTTSSTAVEYQAHCNLESHCSRANALPNKLTA